MGDILTTAGAAGRNAIDGVVDALNALLADVFALYVKTKNFHWHVSGPHFRDYHLLFDEQAVQILQTVDVIAERVRKCGGATLRSIGDIGRRQRISDNDAARVSAAAMLAELEADNRAMAEVLRDLKQIADGARDYATSALVDGWIDDAEQRAWFLQQAADVRG